MFIIVLMSIAVVLLIRNMNKRVRRLPDSFPDPEAERRKAEIAKLDADLDRPDAEPSHPSVDVSRSSAAADDTEAEVSEVKAAEPPAKGRIEQDRA